ncbi:uncharacterized protein LOC130736687 [Lotus japonicus]|uniref:uncharacterized protein LOC130736687 n=1 Tax=Lotus japonicus TaxID=34305 RepID=UPI00258B14B2|nr:uncharacterized protein LOC130736687 [Lotus japonicus]
MLQNLKSFEPTSPIILPYNQQASETQAFETQTSEKPDSEPKSPDHSDRENLSPAPSVSFSTNTPFSSPSNKSESNRQFIQIASERISEIPEHFIQVPSPNRYPGPRPEPLVAPDFPINAVPLNSAPPPPPSPPSSPPPQKEKDFSKVSLSNLSSVKSANFEFPNIDTGTSNQNPETNTTVPKTLNIGSPQGTSEATSSNHPPSPETNMSIIPYTYPKPDTLMSCLNLFHDQASTCIRNLYGQTDHSEKPNLVAEDWGRLCNWMHDQIDEMMLHYNEEREARINAARQRFEARTRRRQSLHERRLREKLYTIMEETRKKKEKAEVVARHEAALRESARLDALEQSARLEVEAAALKAQVLAPVPVTDIASTSAQAPHSDQVAPSAPVQSDSRLDLIERRLDSQEAPLRSLQEMCAEILKRTTKP